MIVSPARVISKLNPNLWKHKIEATLKASRRGFSSGFGSVFRSVFGSGFGSVLDNELFQIINLSTEIYHLMIKTSDNQMRNQSEMSVIPKMLFQSRNPNEFKVLHNYAVHINYYKSKI